VFEIGGSWPIGNGDPIVDGLAVSHGIADDSLSVNHGPAIRRLVQREHNVGSADPASKKSSSVVHLPIPSMREFIEPIPIQRHGK
jgi:hypothetical protein